MLYHAFKVLSILLCKIVCDCFDFVNFVKFF
nr:MAG TPA: hypothetical protein [Microviridae sp.]